MLYDAKKNTARPRKHRMDVFAKNQRPYVPQSAACIMHEPIPVRQMPLSCRKSTKADINILFVRYFAIFKKCYYPKRNSALIFSKEVS